MKNINVGIIGYGLSGRLFHRPFVQAVEGFTLRKIVTQDPLKKFQAQTDCPGVQLVDHPENLFKDPEIDLIVICTPNTLHSIMAEQAMQAGKHVILEKPFTVTAIEAEHLIDVSNNTKRLLSVYHNRRFDSDFRTVKQIISDAQLGRLVEFESHFDRFKPNIKESAWREKPLPGSGTLYDLGSHLIDQALNLFGMPSELYADLRAQRNGSIDDNFELILYYPDLKVTLKAGTLVKEPLPRFILHGTRGTYMKYGMDVQEDALKSGMRPSDHTWGNEPETIWGVLNTIEGRSVIKSAQGDYRDYYRNIYKAVVHGLPLDVTAQDGLNVIRLIEAAIRSHQEKRRITLI